MKILLCHNAYQLMGGEDRVVEAEHQLLLDQGHEVILWVLDNQNIKNVVDKIKAGLDVVYSKPSKKKMQDLLQKHHPDIVHIHNFFPLMTPSVYDACEEARVPVVQTLHNYRLFCANGLLLQDKKACERCLHGSPYQAVKYRCYRQSALQSFAVARMIDQHKKKKTFVNKVSQFIALTEFARKKFITYGIPAEKIRVKPNFLADGLLPHDVQQREPFVLFVGRLSEEKGIESLLSIASESSVQIQVAGAGPMLNKLHSFDNIEYLGELTKTQVSTKMRRATALIIPSLCYEGLPLAMLEAMSCGLPVIASDLGGMAEVIVQQKTGLKVPVNDTQAFIRAIDSLMTDKTLWRSISDAGRQLINTQFSKEENARQLLAIYKDVIHESA